MLYKWNIILIKIIVGSCACLNVISVMSTAGAGHIDRACETFSWQFVSAINRLHDYRVCYSISLSTADISFAAGNGNRNDVIQLISVKQLT